MDRGVGEGEEEEEQGGGKGESLKNFEFKGWKSKQQKAGEISMVQDGEGRGKLNSVFCYELPGTLQVPEQASHCLPLTSFVVRFVSLDEMKGSPTGHFGEIFHL